MGGVVEGDVAAVVAGGVVCIVVRVYGHLDFVRGDGQSGKGGDGDLVVCIGGACGVVIGRTYGECVVDGE